MTNYDIYFKKFQSFNNQHNTNISIILFTKQNVYICQLIKFNHKRLL